MTRRLHCLAAPLALSVLLLAGCSSDDSPPGAAPSVSPGTASSDAESSAPAAADPAADAAAAGRINLNAADLGPGWTSTPDEPEDGSDAEFEKQFLACVGVSPTDDPGDDISSPAFTNADSVELSSGVDFYPTAKDAEAEIAVLGDPKAGTCLESSFADLLGKEIASDGGSVTSVKATVTDASALVAGAKSLKLDIAAAVAGQNLTFTATLVTFTRGRIGVAFSSFVLGATPVPTAISTKALRAVAARAEAEA
jgi:hypothetical protein